MHTERSAVLVSFANYFKMFLSLASPSSASISIYWVVVLSRFRLNFNDDRSCSTSLVAVIHPKFGLPHSLQWFIQKWRNWRLTVKPHQVTKAIKPYLSNKSTPFYCFCFFVWSFVRNQLWPPDVNYPPPLVSFCETNCLFFKFICLGTWLRAE